MSGLIKEIKRDVLDFLNTDNMTDEEFLRRMNAHRERYRDGLAKLFLEIENERR